MIFRYYIDADGAAHQRGLAPGETWTLPPGATEYPDAAALQVAIDAARTPAPDWPQVRQALLNDPAYNAAVEAASNQLAVSRLEAYALQSPDNWGQLATLWNVAIASVPPASQLTPEDCDRLNQLFQSGHLPITLNRTTALMEAPPP